jgi:cellulose synthase/poly-beta-1,6-N-acetylglucosamine synthase-like glycosyltransferase
LAILLSLDNSRHSRNPDLVKISVIIPAYNEAHTIAAVIEQVKSVALNGIQKEIIVVDDASTDGTEGCPQRHSRYLRPDTNAVFTNRASRSMT